MPVKIATGKDLKKVKVFLGKDGRVYEGSIFDKENATSVEHDMGGATVSDRLPGGAEEAKEEKSK